MRKKKNSHSHMIHLSYDAKSEDKMLKQNLTWSLLYFDIDASIESPTQSTILIESNKSFDEWRILLYKQYNHRMFYIISEVMTIGEFYAMEDYPREDDADEPYKTTVENIRDEIIKNRNSGNQS